MEREIEIETEIERDRERETERDRERDSNSKQQSRRAAAKATLLPSILWAKEGQGPSIHCDVLQQTETDFRDHPDQGQQIQ